MSILSRLPKPLPRSIFSTLLVVCSLLGVPQVAASAQIVESTKDLTAEETQLLKTARNLHNQSRHHYDWGRYDSALAAIRQAKDIIEELKGPDDPLIFTFLNDMAYYYRAKGELGPVQGILEELLLKWTELEGEDSVKALLAAQVLAEYFFERRLYSDALAMCEEVAAGFARREPSEANRFYRARILRLRGRILPFVGRLDEAQVALESARDLAEEVFGENDPKTGPYLNDQALFFTRYRRDYERAEGLYKRLLAIVEADTRWPENVRPVKQNLGMLYLRSGKYELGEALLRERYVDDRADGILEEMNSPKLAISASNLGEICWAKGEVEQAVDYWKESTDRSARFENSILAIGTEAERLEYAAALVENVNATVSLHLYGANSNAKAAEMAFMRVLRTKGRVLEAQANTFRLVQNENEPTEIKAQLSALNQLRGQQAFLSLSNSDPERLQSVREEIQELERSLAECSAALIDIAKIVELKDVSAAVPQGAALVEFVRFQPFDVKAQSYGDFHYAAYVLVHDGQPTGFDLGLASAIDSNIVNLRASLTNLSTYSELATKLDSQLVKPWIKAVGEHTQLLLAPDGMLNLLPFECLQPAGEAPLIETYRISYLSSGRRLVTAKDSAKGSPEGAVIVVAAPDYGQPAKDAGKSTTGRFEGLIWTPLPGTEREAQAIVALMKGAQSFTGLAASESRLETVHAPRILHLATHGFFLGQQATSAASLSRGLTITSTSTDPKGELIEAMEQMENPLLLSGLVLAGANQSGTEQDDGYMTALEMSGLDLQGTELVVMSACETGVGKVTSGQGVFGLRRAVALAGAKSQVMSLWKVSDDATTELMRLFYQGLSAGLPRIDALRNAQRSIASTTKWRHPYFWSAFILSGDWR